MNFILEIILSRQSWTFSNDQSPQKIIPLPDLIQPHTMVVDKDQLFIRDSGSSIFIYSLSNFSLIKKFGKQGQGPGEFHDSPLTGCLVESRRSSSSHVNLSANRRGGWHWMVSLAASWQNARSASSIENEL